jgi:iron-sulfur cluster assembly accessory protein
MKEKEMATTTEAAATSLIHITDAAAAKIKELMPKDSEAEHALRMRVVGGGCSGFQYQMGLEATPKENDKVFTSNGIKVFIDMKSALYLAGVEVDYLNGLMESGFKISNPNAKTTCGCGQLFR